MSKEDYKKPELKSDTVEIGTYGAGYDIISPDCVVASETCCKITS